MVMPTSVRQTHPQLYFGVMTYGFWAFFIGLCLMFTNSLVPYRLSPVALGFLFIVFGVMKIYGANHLIHYNVARLGMSLSIGFTHLVGIGLLLEYLAGNPSASLYLIASFEFAGGFIQLAPALEPPLNPYTRDREENSV